jgi:hypothetical protein
VAQGTDGPWEHPRRVADRRATIQPVISHLDTVVAPGPAH